MAIELNRNWKYDLYINGTLYTECETREQCIAEWKEYKRNLRYGRAA